MSTHAVLVVDDDRLMRESLCELLGDLQCRTTAASDGARALEQLGVGRYDLVFSDVDMPDISGFELLSRMRQQFGLEPNVILMSARSHSDLDRSARAAGAIEFLAKPVGLTVLDGVLRRVWGDLP